VVKHFRALGKLIPRETNKGEVFQSLFKYEALDNGRKLEVMDYEYSNSEYFV